MFNAMHLELLKDQFAKALQEKIDQERAEAAEAIEQLSKAHEDQILALRNESQEEYDKRLRRDFEARIKESEKNFAREKKEYESVIEKLRSDFFAFEKKLKEHLIENDQFRDLLTEKQAIIDRLEERNKSLQEDNDEIQERARLIEIEHENLFDKRKSELEAHLKNLLESEKAEFMIQVDEERKQYEEKFKEYDRIVDEMEDRNNQLLLENEKLSELLQEKFEEVELWKSKYAILDTNRLAEIEDLKRRVDRITQMENQLDSLKAKLAEKDTVFILFFIEIERLYSINEKYEREVAQLRHKDDEHVSKYNDIINKLNALDQAEAESEREKIELRKIIIDLNEQIKLLEERLRNALEEGQRLRLFNEERRREIENLKFNFSIEDSESITKEEIRRRDLELLQLENDHVIKIEELTSQIYELKTKVERQNSENQRLKQILADRKRESDDLRATVEEGKRHADKGKNLEAQLLLKTEQYNQMDKELSEMKREREHLQTELYEKNFQTSKKIHDLLQQLINSKALSEQDAHEFIQQHPSIGGPYLGQINLGVSIK